MKTLTPTERVRRFAFIMASAAEQAKQERLNTIAKPTKGLKQDGAVVEPGSQRFLKHLSIS